MCGFWVNYLNNSGWTAKKLDSDIHVPLRKNYEIETELLFGCSDTQISPFAGLILKTLVVP